MPAAIAIFIQFLPQLIQGGAMIAEYVQKQKANWQSTGEWTAEAEAAFTAEIAKLKGPNKPHHWKTDQEIANE